MSADRPEYGEYATPEEQAAAMGVTPEPVTVAPTIVQEPPIAPTVVTGGRRWDRIITIFLLILGVYSTISSVPSYAHFATTMNTFYGLYGYDKSYPEPGLADSLGFILNIVQPVVIVLAIWFSIRSLRARRLSFYIPLIGAVVVVVVTSVVLGVLFSHDPGFAAFMRDSFSPATK